MQTTKPEQPVPTRGRQPVARVDPVATPPRSIDSAALVGTRREVQIRHNGDIHTQRETRQFKRILNKHAGRRQTRLPLQPGVIGPD